MATAPAMTQTTAMPAKTNHPMSMARTLPERTGDGLPSDRRATLLPRLVSAHVAHDVGDERDADDEPPEPGDATNRRVADRPRERGPRQEQETEERDPEGVERGRHAVAIEQPHQEDREARGDERDERDEASTHAPAA